MKFYVNVRSSTLLKANTELRPSMKSYLGRTVYKPREPVAKTSNWTTKIGRNWMGEDCCLIGRGYWSLTSVHVFWGSGGEGLSRCSFLLHLALLRQNFFYSYH